MDIRYPTLKQGIDNTIHKSVIIEGDVSIGSNNYIGPGTILIGPLTIANNNWIVAASIGFPPEHSEWYKSDRETLMGVRIGSNVIIREYVTIHSGFASETVIEDGCFIMTKAHVGHDVIIKSDCTISPASMIGGHVLINTKATIGMNSVVHQNLTIGELVMIGMNSTLTHDVEDYAMSFGTPARVRGINRIGLQRAGWSAEDIDSRERNLFLNMND